MNVTEGAVGTNLNININVFTYYYFLLSNEEQNDHFNLEPDLIYKHLKNATLSCEKIFYLEHRLGYYYYQQLLSTAVYTMYEVLFAIDSITPAISW